MLISFNPCWALILKTHLMTPNLGNSMLFFMKTVKFFDPSRAGYGALKYWFNSVKWCKVSQFKFFKWSEYIWQKVLLFAENATLRLNMFWLACPKRRESSVTQAPTNVWQHPCLKDLQERFSLSFMYSQPCSFDKWDWDHQNTWFWTVR